MKILTFDTSLDKMFVTLSDKGELLESKIIESTQDKYHSAFLMPTLVEILKNSSLTLQDINAIGVNVGPGSFTGIRACVTVARVMGQNLNMPVVGIPSLQILSTANPTDKNSVVLLDARKGKAYTGIYTFEGQIIEPPQAFEYEKAFEFIGSGNFVIADKKMSAMLEEKGIEANVYNEIDYDYGKGLAKLTYQAVINKQDKFSWANLKPLYIQPPPISMPKAKA